MISIQKLITEIGDASLPPYKYKLDYYEVDDEFDYSAEASYSFKTDSDTEYEVNIYDPNRIAKIPRLIISFRTSDGKYEEETNKGEQYRIMSTVVTIVKEHIAILAPKTKELSFSPSKADEKDQRRGNMYKAYVAKQMPGSKVHEYSDGRFIVELPKKK